MHVRRVLVERGAPGRLAPLLPTDTRVGLALVDHRRVTSGIVHVLLSGGRRMDAPACYGPKKTLYNRSVGWPMKGVWQRAFETLAAAGGPPAELVLESSWAEGTPLCRRRQMGAHANAIGRSHGSPTTKAHALVDGFERLVAFTITPSQRCNAPVAPELIGLLPASATLFAYQAYDSDALSPPAPRPRHHCRHPQRTSTQEPAPRAIEPATSRNLV